VAQKLVTYFQMFKTENLASVISVQHTYVRKHVSSCNSSIQL